MFKFVVLERELSRAYLIASLFSLKSQPVYLLREGEPQLGRWLDQSGMFALAIRPSELGDHKFGVAAIHLLVSFLPTVLSNEGQRRGKGRLRPRIWVQCAGGVRDWQQEGISYETIIVMDHVVSGNREGSESRKRLIVKIKDRRTGGLWWGQKICVVGLRKGKLDW